MCECRADIEKRLVEHAQGKMPDARDVAAKLMGYGFVLGGALSVRAFMPVELSHTTTIKKTGADKRKVEKMNMFFSYCPFCGEKFEKSS